MAYRLEIAKRHIGAYRSLLIDDQLDALDPDGATGDLTTLESIRERVADEAGCPTAEAGTIEEVR